LKRSAFAHEHEVRLLYVDADRKYVGKEFIKVPIDVNRVIEEIILDPRVRAGGGGNKRERNGSTQTDSKTGLMRQISN
jgi:hypothetical protein